MRLLGALGLDWRILIIQSINFLILFFVLERLFFRPFIRAIKNEKQLEIFTEQEKKLMDQEKQAWRAEKDEEITKAKEKVDALLEEAEKASINLKNKAKIEEAEKASMAIASIRGRSKSILEDYKNTLAHNYQTEIKKSLMSMFDKDFSEVAKQKVQNSLWPQFIKALEKVDPSKIKAFYIKKILGENFSKLSLEEREKVIKNMSKKIPIVLSSAYGLEKYQIYILNSIIKEKLKKVDFGSMHYFDPKLIAIIKNKLKNINFELVLNIDKKLIAGFYIEIGDVLIEESIRRKSVEIFSN